MLRRLLMALLIACLSVPALALPAGGMQDTSIAVHNGGACAGHDAPDKKHRAPAGGMAHHDCIGCVVPQPAVAAVASPLLPALARTIPLPDGGTPGHGPAPETPPPRS